MKPTPRGWPRISSAAYYENAAQAIDWLCNAFGFEVQLKVEGEGGRIEHSELVFRGGLVMVGEQGSEASNPHRRAPAAVGGGNTQNMFVYVDDIEAHCARARASGATIVSEPAVSDYGDDHWADQGYECVDLGGHHWWFAQRLREGASYAPRLDSRQLGPNPPPRGWPRISSSLYYRDAAQAIDWLCRAFGFEIQIRVEGDAGRIVHSELVFGGGLVMVGDEARDPERWPYRNSPLSLGGANTQNLMVYVDDAKAHCERARAAGARITYEPKVSDYGEDYWSDLSFEAEDIGGHRWWFSERLRG
ncbi:MAG TPA: VOC family protein [Kofleriaceae bacterium]|nr:VOC family protein [Kofleriaceae bacterium]